MRVRGKGDIGAYRRDNNLRRSSRCAGHLHYQLMHIKHRRFRLHLKHPLERRGSTRHQPFYFFLLKKGLIIRTETTFSEPAFGLVLSLVFTFGQ